MIWHWIWLILLAALAMGTAAYGFSKFALPEEYQSTTKIYVLDKSGAGGSNSQTTYSDLQVGIQLTKDYVELIKSRTVLEAVLKDNQLDGVYTYEKFADMVDVETPTDTRIVTITVTNHDPALAQKNGQRYPHPLERTHHQHDADRCGARGSDARVVTRRARTCGEKLNMQDIILRDDNLTYRSREAYRTLRSNIEFSGKDVKTIAITSCTPNEGKSFRNRD